MSDSLAVPLATGEDLRQVAECDSDSHGLRIARVLALADALDRFYATPGLQEAMDRIGWLVAKQREFLVLSGRYHTSDQLAANTIITAVRTLLPEGGSR